MQVPSNMIASKISRPGLYICAAMALWGALSAITAAVHNFAGLVVCRFMLGFVESVFFPGAVRLASYFPDPYSPRNAPTDPHSSAPSRCSTFRPSTIRPSSRLVSQFYTLDHSWVRLLSALSGWLIAPYSFSACLLASAETDRLFSTLR